MDGTLAAAQVDASGRLGAAFTRALDNLGPDLEPTEESAAEPLRAIAAATSIERGHELDDAAAAAEAVARRFTRAAARGLETS